MVFEHDPTAHELFPIGFELAEWPMRYRAIVYACLWLIMVVICQNMVFIYMGPELDGPRWAGH